MSNSALVSYTCLSPNHSGTRNHVIDTVSIHCMAGNLTIESCGALFAKSSTAASSNYGIGSDGRIALYVDEANRSWCTSSSSNDNRAVTIEVANTQASDPYPVSDAAYESLINLLVDICQRNGIKKLLWQADKSLIGQVDKQNMTVHRWFAAKACPGTWLYERHGQIAAEVNERLSETEDDIMTGEEIYNALNEYLVDMDAPDWAQDELQEAIDMGITDGTRPMQFIPRYQAAIMAKRAAKAK
ncbi:MAG: N-acetylmuramoyl-L-alanine amidase [Oscillospiraceae bacterium]|nr:N-acetylmuramoyl-L-alanine amidase [Oscillospiraceae bacterium]